MAHRRDDKEQNLLRQLQGDLPAEKRPFRVVASRAGTSEESVLDTLRSLIHEGRIRKFGALLRHQKAGVTRNAMVVWAVPPDRTDEAGRIFVSFPEITHCYERRPPFQGRYYDPRREKFPGGAHGQDRIQGGDWRLPGAREPGGVQEDQHGILLIPFRNPCYVLRVKCYERRDPSPSAHNT
jgi:DNA-binding Lrp family transcriptional regulator